MSHGLPIRPRLWIGGSSGLAQTYFAAYPDEASILLGKERDAPHWACGRHCYIPCDLIQLPDDGTSVLDDVLSQLERGLRTLGCFGSDSRQLPLEIVVSIRPPLVTHRSNQAADIYCHSLLKGLQLLLQHILERYTVRMIVHISSIAAVGHIQTQHLHSTTTMRDPPSAALVQPYDRFKRRCEEMIEKLCLERPSLLSDANNSSHNNNNSNNNNIQPHQKHVTYYTSLRLGAIFSDKPTCIQCSALALQCYTGPYLPTPIDCNSSRNAAHMIHLILDYWQRPGQQLLRPVYYYTRCLSQYPQPVPYGEYLMAYYTVNHKYVSGWWHLIFWVPHWLVFWAFVQPWHRCTRLFTTYMPFIQIPFIESIDYLLQVTVNEHSFDMSETLQDFPDIVHREETMVACFQRRRRMQHLLPTNNDAEKIA